MYIQLKILMMKNKITLKMLSSLLNVSRNTISKKINGKAKFTIEEFLKIKKTYFSNVSLELLTQKD